MRPDIAELLRDNGGVIRRAEHPSLRNQLDRLRARGELAAPLPGILCLPGRPRDHVTDIRLGSAWAGPDAILVGRAAAVLTFWPAAQIDRIEFAVPRHTTRSAGKVRLGFRTVPPEYVIQRDGLRLTSAPLTAVDLASEHDGGDAIDTVLRSRQANLDQLWEAFRACPGRAGNRRREQLLLDSRNNPWSAGERRLHRLLRQHRIIGWTANRTLWLPNDQDYVPDVLFRRERLILEFDGYLYHSDPATFEKDRERRNELELAGYLVLNFTWQQITERPDWVIDCVTRALAQRG